MYTYNYPHPAMTADAVLFGFDGKELHILLIERGVEPFLGSWALPGGFMHLDETIEECALRELREETGVKDVYLEQFHVFSEVGRDPRERVVTVAFFALVRKADFQLIAGDDASNAMWFGVDELPPLAFDHHEIIKLGREKLREVLRTRPVAFRLLDRTFTMTELQNLYEAINGTTYDRRNFAKKMNSTGLLDSQSKLSFKRSPVASSAAKFDDMQVLGTTTGVPMSESAEYMKAESEPSLAKTGGSKLYCFDEEAYDEEVAANPNGRNPFTI